MITFLKKRKENHKTNELTDITLNVFFDELYYPFSIKTKKNHHNDYGNYNRHLRKQLGCTKLTALKNQQLDNWVQNQIELDLQRSTINKHIFLINRIINLARHWNYLPQYSRELQTLTPLKIGDFHQRFLSEHEITLMLEATQTISHPFLHYFVKLLLLTGARKSEARLSKWSHFDLENKIWTVPKSKNGRARRIVLSDATINLLKLIEKRGNEVCSHIPNREYLFINPKTGTAYDSFYRAWYEARDKAKLSDVRLHDLRHTFASLLINKGVSLYEVQTLLGHSSPQMTQRYAHLQPNLLHARTEIVANMVHG